MKNSINATEKLSVTIAVFFAVVVCSTFFLSGFSNVYGVEVFSKDEKPFGIPFDEWVGKVLEMVDYSDARTIGTTKW